MKKYPSQRYRLQEGSAFALPFSEATFDLVVNNFMLDLLPEKDFMTILSEFRRVLKPGGWVVISTMTFGRQWYNKYWDWIAQYMPSLLTGCRPVRMSGPLAEAGFDSISSVYVSQNTFPSEVLRARAVTHLTAA